VSIDSRIVGDFKLKEIQIKTRRALRKGMYRIGKDLESTLKRDILKKPKSGRTYIRKTANGRRRRHIASAPGETVANRTGNYRNSVGFKVGQDKIEFGAGVEYAGFLENGTPKMGARPSLKNTIKSKYKDMRGDIQTALEREFR